LTDAAMEGCYDDDDSDEKGNKYVDNFHDDYPHAYIVEIGHYDREGTWKGAQEPRTRQKPKRRQAQLQGDGFHKTLKYSNFRTVRYEPTERYFDSVSSDCDVGDEDYEWVYDECCTETAAAIVLGDDSSTKVPQAPPPPPSQPPLPPQEHQPAVETLSAPRPQLHMFLMPPTAQCHLSTNNMMSSMLSGGGEATQHVPDIEKVFE
jgi:hypothetical protein